MIVVGLMSGTSADGTDAAVVEITGDPPHLAWKLLSYLNIPHSSEIRARILTCCQPQSSRVDLICELNAQLGQVFGTAALQAIRAAGLDPAEVDLIGSHGQTVWHIPTGEAASTLQLGEAAVIAELTGIPVVHNFRPRDMAAGGQGAPLVSYVDELLFKHSTRIRTLQNIGGIANLTYLSPDSDPFAFDTGPGNVLIDDAVGRATQGQLAFDPDGTLAASGTVDHVLLAQLMQDPYFQLPPPKTTGRELFGSELGARLWAESQARQQPTSDLIATLSALTAHSIAHAYRTHLPSLPDEMVVSGGGTKNLTLMRLIADQLPEVRIRLLDELGLSATAKEAVAFAVLAYETWHQRPSNCPSATGARHRVILGHVTYAQPKSRIRTGSFTEGRNPATEQIDTLSTLEMVKQINLEDQKVAIAVGEERVAIAAAIDGIAERMGSGGRLIYLGAGTSGRLGVLDAAECPPTFNTRPEQVIGLIAGGSVALTQAVEGAEDSQAQGSRDIADLKVTELDSVIGIAASGSTPYVLGGMSAASERGALVISLACNRPSAIEELATISIAPLVGAEVITGSTRLKAGTAQKLVLNQISTGVMIRLGKTYGNLMVDVQATNQKLQQRAQRIVEQACDLTPEAAQEQLERCGGEVKVAIVAALLNLDPVVARQRLAESGGRIREVLGQ